VNKKPIEASQNYDKEICRGKGDILISIQDYAEVNFSE